ncbi:hypothetical protein [Hymenobacter bucti]|uniref:Outer membrane protein beta-barrel domain-containing protein n=1 Tax=Hymenobacter bucti TaxID=1844114 RepID=A0ABW4QZR3_9BACT
MAADSAPRHRFYVGAGAYTSQHEHWGARYGLPATRPVQVAFGYRLRPRLALELNAVTAATHGAVFGFTPQATGAPLPYTSTYANRSTSVAALVRYALVRSPARRLQVDGVGGLTLHRFSFDGTGLYPDNAAPGGFRYYDLHSRDGDVLFTAGVSVRYRLCPHLEVVADGTLSPSLRALRDVTAAAAVGLRYNFGH